MAVFIATLGGIGFTPGAPGTAGSLAAWPVGILAAFAFGPAGLIAGIVLVGLAGWWASAVYVVATGREDPGEVVIDEAAGLWIALLPAGLEPLALLAGLVLFRLFDIAKPWPIGGIDRKIKGGLGIMLDDLVAGAMAALVLQGALMVLKG